MHTASDRVEYLKPYHEPSDRRSCEPFPLIPEGVNKRHTSIRPDAYGGPKLLLIVKSRRYSFGE